ncbi:cytochrome c oxidase assembly factor 5-like [Mizuhopecten yessoensis]|uniref:Cytochrome c oxidase assembly factor 5 n=1 Tax=Mizuhopecten yessoensis TaxID=6573 RepID=A0A210QW90_MIZYE|nr:cytochrome c oxidase assembly factor 5-like [Mizuhopecten yessoensis]OWF52932.1 Cytochrome c oxidase assembly factor 5 [Mizuhopecten yessoensis]
MWPFDDEASKPKKSCETQRQQLQDCLLMSPCVNRDGNTPKQCLKMKGHPSVPDECFSLCHSFFLCKRSMVDMRARFRGRSGVDYDAIHYGPKKDE